jgi:hypothetical protein
MDKSEYCDAPSLINAVHRRGPFGVALRRRGPRRDGNGGIIHPDFSFALFVSIIDLMAKKATMTMKRTSTPAGISVVVPSKDAVRRSRPTLAELNARMNANPEKIARKFRENTKRIAGKPCL